MNAHRQSMARLKHIFGLIVSLATVVSTAACGDTSMRSTAPDPTPTPVVDTTPDFTGIWVGVSRVISCEHSAGGCANFAVGDARYLDFRLTQRGNDVTGNLSPTQGRAHGYSRGLLDIRTSRVRQTHIPTYGRGRSIGWHHLVLR